MHGGGQTSKGFCGKLVVVSDDFGDVRLPDAAPAAFGGSQLVVTEVQDLQPVKPPGQCRQVSQAGQLVVAHVEGVKTGHGAPVVAQLVEYVVIP